MNITSCGQIDVSNKNAVKKTQNTRTRKKIYDKNNSVKIDCN